MLAGPGSKNLKTGDRDILMWIGQYERDKRFVICHTCDQLKINMVYIS